MRPKRSKKAPTCDTTISGMMLPMEYGDVRCDLPLISWRNVKPLPECPLSERRDTQAHTEGLRPLSPPIGRVSNTFSSLFFLRCHLLIRTLASIGYTSGILHFSWLTSPGKTTFLPSPVICSYRHMGFY